MIYYVLPSPGIFGGVKLGFQFVELLRKDGIPAVVLTPGGEAPQWFYCSVPVGPLEQFLPRVSSDDTIIFSLPSHYPLLRSLPAQLVFHCMGTDPAIDQILADPTVINLTCWSQAYDYVSATCGRVPIEVGISISDIFAYNGETKEPLSIAYLPRRGDLGIIAELQQHSDFILQPIDGLTESNVAQRLKNADMFLAISSGEWFGLPALEAMAAGCLVFSVPTLGGMEYLHDGVNCFVREEAQMVSHILAVFRERSRESRELVRHNAVKTAQPYLTSARNRSIPEILRPKMAATFP